jgi:Uma2 family endonuclease
LLLTDLLSSTELLQRAGDEQAQRIFQAHHSLLRDAVVAHGGREVKWLRSAPSARSPYSASRHCPPRWTGLGSATMEAAPHGAPDLSRLPATQEEFETWCATFDGSELGRFEFLYGCVVAEPPAHWPHGKLGVTLSHRLASHVEDRRLGLVFDASQGFALPSGDTVAPDIAVVLCETWEAAPPPTPDRFLTVVPDLVVEVLSPSTARRDRGPKRDIYERNGVREYWLLDPRRREITVIGRDADGRLGSESTVADDHPARSVLLAGFSVRPAEIFP